jgi:Yip1 domain
LVQDHIGSPTTSPPKGINLSTENPFLTIWTRPRATIRGIVNANPAFRVLPIAMIGGMLEMLQLESLVFAGDQLSVPIILLIAVVIGPPLGLIFLYSGAWIVEMSCRLLGGQADSREVRSALAWSSVPLLATIPLWMIRLAFLGRELFTVAKPSLSSRPALAYFLAATAIPEIVLSIWWMVVTVKALGEVQRFSAWKALSSMILLLVPPIVLILILAIVAYFFLKNLLY